MTAGSRQRGVTLLELVVCVAVIGLMAAVAVPGLHHWLAGARLVADTNRLVGALTLARTTALTRRQEGRVLVVVCGGRWRLEVLAGDADAGGCQSTPSAHGDVLMVDEAAHTDGTRVSPGGVSFDLMGRLDECSYGSPCRWQLRGTGGEGRWVSVEPSGVVRSGDEEDAA